MVKEYEHVDRGWEFEYNGAHSPIIDIMHTKGDGILANVCRHMTFILMEGHCCPPQDVMLYFHASYLHLLTPYGSLFNCSTKFLLSYVLALSLL